MNKLVAHMIPGLLVIVAFMAVKNFLVPINVTFESWFVYLSAAVYVLAVVVPCVIYYLRTPPGIDHK
jgi:hypothetical protein